MLNRDGVILATQASTKIALTNKKLQTAIELGRYTMTKAEIENLIDLLNEAMDDIDSLIRMPSDGR